MTKKLTEADVRKMSPEERKKMRLALNPRRKALGLRFNARDIANWTLAASLQPKRSLTDFMEEVMNRAASEEIRRARGK